MSEDLDWTEAGPRSRRFEDVYFSAEDGLAESRLVFLQGCGLPERWIGRERFVVGELGFGTGLNVAALVQLWRRERPPGGRLHVFSVEGFPMPREAAARALGAWPELGEVTAALLERWPTARRGVHRLELPAWGVIVDLAIGEVAPALRAWSGRADAWFLDGFAPSRNPEMWTPEVLSLVAERSAPGACAATYTVAGAVRRGLEAAGFALTRQPGFGRKKERLKAELPGEPPRSSPTPRVAIVGGGIGGAALARALLALGAAPVLIEAEALGAGASGNPAALVTPWLDAGLGPAARLHAAAFARAVDLYRKKAPEAVFGGRVLQLVRQSRDGARFAAVAEWDAFSPGSLTLLDPEAASADLGEPTGAALRFEDGLVIEPHRVLEVWTAGVELRVGRVAELQEGPSGWRLLDADGALIVEADIVCLTGGLGVAALAPMLPLRPVRGQASWAELGVNPVPELFHVKHSGRITPAAWGGYAIPTRTGVLFGATHQRGETDCAVCPEDDERNRRTLAEARPRLASALAGTPLHSRAAVRMTTPDHLPLVGDVPDRPGLQLLTGFGGRGFTLAPLLAEHLAAVLLGAPSPLPGDLAGLLAPERFTVKSAARL